MNTSQIHFIFSIINTGLVSFGFGLLFSELPSLPNIILFEIVILFSLLVVWLVLGKQFLNWSSHVVANFIRLGKKTWQYHSIFSGFWVWSMEDAWQTCNKILLTTMKRKKEIPELKIIAQIVFMFIIIQLSALTSTLFFPFLINLIKSGSPSSSIIGVGMYAW